VADSSAVLKHGIVTERSIALCVADHQSRELFGAKLDERLFIQRWLARDFSFPLFSVARHFARQRVAERSPSLIHCSTVPRLL
jgi:hypothetical protein